MSGAVICILAVLVGIIADIGCAILLYRHRHPMPKGGTVPGYRATDGEILVLLDDDVYDE